MQERFEVIEGPGQRGYVKRKLCDILTSADERRKLDAKSRGRMGENSKQGKLRTRCLLKKRIRACLITFRQKC